MLTGNAHAFVQLLDVLQGKPLADTQRHRHLARGAIHSIHIAQIHHNGLVTQMHQRHIGQVEVDTLEQEVGRDKCLTVVAIVDHCAVVPHAPMGGVVAHRKRASQVLNQSKLAQCGNLGFFH